MNLAADGIPYFDITERRGFFCDGFEPGRFFADMMDAWENEANRRERPTPMPGSTSADRLPARRPHLMG